ncbi:MAG: adenylosuccinate lyase [Chloroflexota bacterium]|nr:adenylosuccinate lyase [Chloroflexota bacterium]
MIDRYARPKMKSIWEDENKFNKWLQVELAVCEAWVDEGSIPKNALPELKKATFDMGRWEQAFSRTRHDVTAFLESISASIGPESRFIHLGLTSSDVWDTATGLQLRESSDLILEGINNLEKILVKQAKKYKDTLMVGRTHGIHAEPTTFGFKLALWVEEIRRGKQRLIDSRKTISIGKISGAVGTHATLPPEVETKACDLLNLEPEPIASQIVPRDRHAEFITTLALIAASLEKFATEIRSLQKTEVMEVEEPFGEGQTGSSAMPHKRNPELSERVCGLARIIRGNAMASIENVALWHERDISHSSAERIILPDTCMALDYMLHIFSDVMENLTVNENRMYENMEATRGLLFSQRLLLKLIEKGLSRTDAYKIVQDAATQSWADHSDFRDLIRNNTSVTSMVDREELNSVFEYQYYTRYISQSFERIGLN